jgi:hypothetical protein
VADNHAARRAVLARADLNQIPAIIGGNEYFDSEAYVYFPEWINTNRDPRVRYPNIRTDNTGNPLGCTGPAQEASPQLAIANHACASKILMLLWAWLMTDTEGEFLPYELSSNLYGCNYLRQYAV